MVISKPVMDGERCTEVKVEGQPRYPFGAIGGVRAENEVRAWLVSEGFLTSAKSGSRAERAAGAESGGTHRTTEQDRWERVQWGQGLQVVASH